MPDLNLDEIERRIVRYEQVPSGTVVDAVADIHALVAEMKRLNAIIKAEWNDMSTAPKTGPVREVALLTSGGIVPRAHWAYGEGDGLMPAFGPAWFKPSGGGYVEVQGKILGWRELPENIRVDALEEAAKICDRLKVAECLARQDEDDDIWNDALDQASEKSRALKTNKGE